MVCFEERSAQEKYTPRKKITGKQKNDKQNQRTTGLPYNIHCTIFYNKLPSFIKFQIKTKN
jgi:hypothetical protein